MPSSALSKLIIIIFVVQIQRVTVLTDLKSEEIKIKQIRTAAWISGYGANRLEMTKKEKKQLDRVELYRSYNKSVYFSK